jgi:uncharacterized iron-regulated membrane protein
MLHNRRIARILLFFGGIHLIVLSLAGVVLWPQAYGLTVG